MKSYQKKNIIDYNTFDYIKYNNITNNNFNKITAWKKYIKNPIDIILDTIDISYINTIIKILNIGISHNYEQLLIIINDIGCINIKNISWLSDNIQEFEIKNAEILITSFTNNEKYNENIEIINSISNITSFIIKKNMYINFLNKLNIKNISWQSCLFQIIDEHKFKCYQLNLNLF